MFNNKAIKFLNRTMIILMWIRPWMSCRCWCVLLIIPVSYNIETSSYVFHLLKTVQHDGLTARSAEEAVVTLVNRGGDADTIGAITESQRESHALQRSRKSLCDLLAHQKSTRLLGTGMNPISPPQTTFGVLHRYF